MQAKDQGGVKDNFRKDKFNPKIQVSSIVVGQRGYPALYSFSVPGSIARTSLLSFS